MQDRSLEKCKEMFKKFNICVYSSYLKNVFLITQITKPDQLNRSFLYMKSGVQFWQVINCGNHLLILL